MTAEDELQAMGREALQLERTGRLDEAEVAYQTSRPSTEVYLNRKKCISTGTSSIPIACVVLMRSGVPSADRASLGFALGVALKKASAYDRDQHERFIDALISTFSGATQPSRRLVLRAGGILDDKQLQVTFFPEGFS